MGPRLSKHFGLVNDKIQTVKVGEIVDWLIGIVENSRHRLKKREVGKEGGREDGRINREGRREGEGKEGKEERDKKIEGQKKARRKEGQEGEERTGKREILHCDATLNPPPPSHSPSPPTPHLPSLTSMFLRALSHSFCPGPEVEQRSRRLLIASVRALAAAASWFMTLGALGSAERALAARSSLLEETEMVRRYPSISLQLSRS